MYTNRSYLTKKPDATAIDVPDCPTDTISDISCNIESTHVAVSSWDGSVKVYKISVPTMGFTTASPSLICEKTFQLGKPCLSVCFFASYVVAGLVDGSMIVIDMAGNQNAIQAHGAGLKSIKNFANQFLITGSFDSTLKFWDLKSTNPMHAISLSGKVYAMDLRLKFLVVALSDRTVQTYDMTNISLSSTFNTRLNYAIRSIGCANDSDSFAVGGIEAKIEIFSKAEESKKIMMRCHRVGTKLYSSSVVRFHPSDPCTLVSGGSDGTLVWYDKSNRLKISSSEYQTPITAGDFTGDGKLFIFALGDDWSKGYTGQPVKTSLKFIDVKTIPGLNK